MDKQPEEREWPAPRVPRPDPLNALLRQERAGRRLPPDAACVICGETDPVLLERHHIAGRANDEESVVVLCLNHHRQQSASQTASGIDLDSGRERSFLDRLVAWLRGLALMFMALARTCRAMADRVTTHIEHLDANFPEWRTRPETEQ